MRRSDFIKIAASRKPNSVSLDSRSARTHVRAEHSLRTNDHSSSSAITGGIKRPTRKLCRRAVRCGFHRALPYLVLLRAGFGLPRVLPRARCALTAPFHPYPSTQSALACEPSSGRYIFCATVLQVALTGRYPAHCPSEFGLSSLRLHLPSPAFALTGYGAAAARLRRTAIVWSPAADVIRPFPA